MAQAYKVLGQVNPAASTETAVYTVPAGKSAIGSTIVIANNGAPGTTFRISVAIAGAAYNIKQNIVPESTPIGGRAVISMTIGITLAETDVIRVFTASANLSVNVFGTEITP